jgi:hypothetical protein
MSAHQMVCHLSDSLRMVLGQKPASPATSVLMRTVVKWIALYVPMPWPPGVMTRPEMDQELGGTRPTEFTTDVAALLALLQAFTAETRDVGGVSHPMFGSLSDAAWLRWGYLHMDHHLRQFGA